MLNQKRLIDANVKCTINATNLTGHIMCLDGGVMKVIDRYGKTICVFSANDIPSTNEEMVSGQWVDCVEYDGGRRVVATCSHCKERGEVRTTRTQFGFWKINSPYCPNCKSKMN